MARKGKWIEDVSVSTPLAEVAAQAIHARVEMVWDYLKLAAKEPLEEIQNVHQLRVASRRSMAAMQIFAAQLPPRRALWMTRQLKRVRRAAGEARDLDVLAERIRTRAAERPTAAWSILLACVVAQRAAAQQPIATIHDKLDRKDFPKRLATLVKRIGPQSKLDRLIEPKYGAAARRTMRLLADDFFALASANFANDQMLHAFRIQGKQLRYAMEIFAAAFEPAFRRELYPQVEKLQEKLGQVNDHVAAQARLREWLAEGKDANVAAAVARWIDEEQSQLTESRAEFLSWWTPGRRDDLKRQFMKIVCS